MKQRLDKVLLDRKLVDSRSRAQALVLAGWVMVSGEVHQKPGTQVPIDAEIRILGDIPYVSRGGLKLEAVLKSFALDITDKVAADIGASTGGFTDCLLKHGAKRVYAIDVGHDQLAASLRKDERVVVLDGINAHYSIQLPEAISLVTVDVSFISLRMVLANLFDLLTQDAQVIALIKPQFEAGREAVRKGGIVRQPSVHRRVLRDVLRFATGIGFGIRGLIRSPVLGADGNTEFLAWMSVKDQGGGGEAISLEDAIERVLNGNKDG